MQTVVDMSHITILCYVYHYWTSLSLMDRITHELDHSKLCSKLYLASFPGLHAQLLLLAVCKVGDGLDGFIM